MGSPPSEQRPADFVPARRLPLLYLGVAHLSLLAAAGVAAFDPVSITGFYYHPLMIGVVHLVTLGWITASIIGSVFIVGPLALGMPMKVERLDYWAYAFFTIGMVGMVSHFWIEQFSGMAWSAGMVLAALVQFASRVARQLRRSRLPGAVALHLWLAMVNLLGAATIGVLIGADREVDVMPGFSLSNAYAHAHLAGVGWALMMVVGVGYRMLPMVLPAAMPSGPPLLASAILIEVGVIGLVVSLLRGTSVGLFAIFISAGVAAFLWNLRWMLGHRRSPPAGLLTPDWGTLQSMTAIGYLGLAVAAGLWVALMPATAASAQVAVFYGVVGLVGFLSQIVVGIEARILPLFAWQTAYAESGYTRQPPSPHRMGFPRSRGVIFALWALAVPALAVGLTLEIPAWVRVAGLALCPAVALQGLNAIRILKRSA